MGKSRLLTVMLLIGLAIVLAGCGESVRSAATAPTATSSFPTVAPGAPAAAARFATTTVGTPARLAATTPTGRAPRVTHVPADSAAKPATKQTHEARMAAIVNGEGIPLWEFDALLQLNLQTSGVTVTAPASQPWQTVRDRTARQIVDEALLNAYAAAHGLAVTGALVDARMEAYRAQSGAGFAASLAHLGVTEAQFRRMVARNLNAQAVTRQVIDAIKAPVVRVQALQIVVSSRARAQSVRAQLLRGADASLLSVRLSSDPTVRRLAGQLPPLTRAEGDALYGPRWSSAAFALTPGAISAPVQVRGGWAVIQCVERQPEAGLMSRALASFLTTLHRTARISSYVH